MLGSLRCFKAGLDARLSSLGLARPVVGVHVRSDKSKQPTGDPTGVWSFFFRHGDVGFAEYQNKPFIPWEDYAQVRKMHAHWFMVTFF